MVWKASERVMEGIGMNVCATPTGFSSHVALWADQGDAPSGLLQRTIEHQALLSIEVDRRIPIMTVDHITTQLDNVWLKAWIHAVEDRMIDESFLVRINQIVALLACHHPVGAGERRGKPD